MIMMIEQLNVSTKAFVSHVNLANYHGNSELLGVRVYCIAVYPFKDWKNIIMSIINNLSDGLEKIAANFDLPHLHIWSKHNMNLATNQFNGPKIRKR